MKYSKKRIINRSIPDNDPNGLRDIIRVVRDLTVKDVKLNVNIQHPYSGDISVELHSPNGKKKVLQSPSRVPGKNLNKTFSGDIMEIFAGQKSKGEWLLKVIDSGAKDNGSVIDWSLHLTVANSKRTEIFVDDKETLSSSQICHQGGIITDVSCKLNIQHSHIGDLHCELSGPSGKSVVLHNKTGGATKNLDKTFSSDVLGDFLGEKAKGKWTLKVNDTLKGDAGRLVSWKLNVKTQNKPKKTSSKDDLTKIEGVGPKIMELLNNAGITTFSQLSNTDATVVKDILLKAGPRFKMHDPGSWAKQSKLAAEGNWNELKKLQDELDGGR